MRAVPLAVAVLVVIPCVAWSQGTPLGPEFRVNTYTTNDQVQPSIAVDPSGNFVVVWENGPPGGFARSIFGQRYANSGAPLGPEFRVNTNPGDRNSVPSVAADSAGNFVVIYEFSVLAPAGLRGQRYASSGVPLGGEFSAGNSGYSAGPAVASDSAGNFVVVWDAVFPGDGSGRGVFGQRYASSGPPIGSAFRVNTYTTGDQTVASVAADGSGNFVVVWTSNAQDGSGLGVFGQRYASSGAPLGSEFRVNTHTTDSQARPSVAADSSGNFVVVWQSTSQDGSGEGVFGQRYASSGAPLGPEFRLNTLTTSNQARPSVASDADGNFVVTWSSLNQDGAGYGIFGQRHESLGTPLGTEFRVNAYSTNDQEQPAVAADPLGKFVVVWASNLQDGSGRGVFGQRYSPIFPVELLNFRVE